MRPKSSTITLRPITADDVLAAGSPYRDCEVWDGVPVACEPTTGWSDRVGTRLVHRLETHVRERRLGWVFGSSQGFLVARSPDRLLSPDASFVSFARLATIPADAFVGLAPDFAVEVRSPTDPLAASLGKGQLWIGSGAPVVWVVDPEARAVVVLRPREAPKILRGGQPADARPTLPDFRLAASWLFSEMPGGASLSGPEGPLDSEPPAP